MPVGIIEAKREDEGHRLTVVEDQSLNYAKAKLKYLQHEDLSFVYESTGTITRFTDYRDPKPRWKNVFGFHKPETIAEWLKKKMEGWSMTVCPHDLMCYTLLFFSFCHWKRLVLIPCEYKMDILL